MKRYTLHSNLMLLSNQSGTDIFLQTWTKDNLKVRRFQTLFDIQHIYIKQQIVVKLLVNTSNILFGIFILMIIVNLLFIRIRSSSGYNTFCTAHFTCFVQLTKQVNSASMSLYEIRPCAKTTLYIWAMRLEQNSINHSIYL